MTRGKFGLALFVCAVIGARAEAQEAPIGFIKTLTGHATVTHDGHGVSAVVTMPVFQTDIVETAGDGALGITFRDDTRVAIGPGSRLELARFVFKPADQQYGFVLRLLYGSLEYLSGLTAKLDPNAMSIETPSFTVAVRGTRFVLRSYRY